MQESSTHPTQEQSGTGIEATVKLYVKLGNIVALSEQKIHRLKLLSQHKDTSDFSLRVLSEHFQKDIAAIDVGIRELLKREPPRGFVDICTAEKIAGWAQYVRYPELPVTLNVYFDQKLAAQVVADRFRPDLERAKLGSGQHGFEFIPPKELFLGAEVIEVRAPNGSVIGKPPTSSD